MKALQFSDAQRAFILRQGADGVRVVVRHVLEQAVARQREVPGVQYTGAVMQHMVGAKLDCVLGKGTV
jgi:hypothetical protein